MMMMSCAVLCDYLYLQRFVCIDMLCADGGTSSNYSEPGVCNRDWALKCAH